MTTKRRAAVAPRMKPRTAPRIARLGAPRRRTQEERRASTRARLLESALGTLVEEGYAGFTTTAVCKRGGLSQGALFLHFPTKSALLATTIEYLFADLVASYQSRFARLDGARDRLSSALELLWDVFRDPRLAAAYELYTAARTDAELRTNLAPVLDRHAQNLRTVATALFPESAGDPGRFEQCVSLVLMAMQGYALSALVAPAEPHAQPAIPFLRETYRALLDRKTPTRR